jgi:hypothetical protein
MAFLVYKIIGRQTMWLKSISPAVTWGPRRQARTFATKGEATRALSSLKPRDAKIAKIMVGDRQAAD